MAISSTDRAGLVMSRRYEGREITSPERTKMSMEPKLKTEQKVAVVYYLSRNGQLDHPHFLEVPLPSSQGLNLKDVISTLNILRGPGMASMYTWSSKRSYRNGYVWQDLLEDDFIHPCHGHEYILKGSLLMEGSLSCRSVETISSSTSKTSSDLNSSIQEDSDSPVIRRRNNSWSTIDNPEENKVYQAKTTGESAEKCTNAATQTSDNGREKMEAKENEHQELGNNEGMEEISPQSFEGSSMKHQRGGRDHPSGRTKASLLLLKLLGCGPRRSKDLDQRKTRN